MSEWIDISMPLKSDMVLWPGQQAPSLTWNGRFEDGNRSITSVIATNSHNGTHVDAPLHFTPGGATIDELPLDPYLGAAEVIDATGATAVTAELLAERVPAGTERVLLRTDNSLHRAAAGSDFDTSFIGLTTDGAHWLVEAGVRLVGNDYPSIAVYEGDSEIHLALMRAGVGILEGLVLDHVEPGPYDLVCLPVLVVGAEGAPARAVIRPR